MPYQGVSNLAGKTYLTEYTACVNGTLGAKGAYCGIPYSSGECFIFLPAF